MAENSRKLSKQPKSTVEKELRLRHLKDRQNGEKQRKLQEIKPQAPAVQVFKEQERFRRLDDLKYRDDERRIQVEERKKRIQKAERDRLEFILRRNQEREQRFESRRRNERNNTVFAFGSSTPRMLDPNDVIASYWNTGRSSSIQNIVTSTNPSMLTRRQPERKQDAGTKKHAISATGLARTGETSSLPRSSLNKQSTTSFANSESVRHRLTTAPKNSIPVSGISSDTKGNNKPPLLKTKKLLAKPTTRQKVVLKSKTKTRVESCSNDIAKLNKSEKPQVAIPLPKPETHVLTEPKLVVRDIRDIISIFYLPQTTKSDLESPQVKKFEENSDKTEPILVELEDKKDVGEKDKKDVMEIETVKMSEPETNDTDVTEIQKFEQVQLIIDESYTSSEVEIRSVIEKPEQKHFLQENSVEPKKPESTSEAQIVVDNNTIENIENKMTISMTKVRINTAEEDIAALAERRRLISEEAARQAELEMLRFETEAKAELERQQREEEQIRELIQFHRESEQQRLKEVIKETQRREEEEKLKKEEKLRLKFLKEEVKKKFKEPSSSLTQQSTTSFANSASVRQRLTTAPRKPRPVSIAITGISSGTKGDNKPPLPMTKNILAKPTTSKNVVLKSKTKTPVNSFFNNTTKVSKSEIPQVEIIPPKPDIYVLTEPKLVTKDIESNVYVPQNTKSDLESPQVKKLVEDNDKKEPILVELEDKKGVMKIGTVNMSEPEKSDTNVTEIQESEQVQLSIDESHTSSEVEIRAVIERPEPESLLKEKPVEPKKPESTSEAQIVVDSNTIENIDNEMTTSMTKVRINTEEEPKSAIAERQRLIRGEVKGQAKLERLRNNSKVKEELERHQREEEQIRELRELQRQTKQERLQGVIKETQRYEEKEKLKKEGELRLTEEAKKKVKEPSLTQESTTRFTNSASVRHRLTKAPRKHRPVSRISSDTKCDNQPPLSKSKKLLSKPTTSKNVLKSKTKTGVDSSSNNTTKVSKFEKQSVAITPPKLETHVLIEPNLVTRDIKSNVHVSQTPKRVLESPPVKKLEEDSEKTEPILVEFDDKKDVEEQDKKDIMKIETVKMSEPETSDIHVTEIQKSEQVQLSIDESYTSSGAEIRSLIEKPEPILQKNPIKPKKPESTSEAQIVVDSNTIENIEKKMTTSMKKVRINTEEEAKAALAERRRLIREEAERQVELERLRIEAEAKAELERQQREEEQTRELIELQRQMEQQRLQKAIKENQRRKQEEKLKNEEELRLKLLKEEAKKKAKEDAQRQKAKLRERLKTEEVERQARRKKVEAIMSRTRGKNATPQSVDENKSDNIKSEVIK
uniref:Calponin homology domain-containing protein DDB_G0272472-like n=1 Tax=Diabrotica virgifera virgifera TaxID=50390 RepID=A0A6P7F305_DIAVI